MRDHQLRFMSAAIMLWAALCAGAAIAAGDGKTGPLSPAVAAKSQSFKEITGKLGSAKQMRVIVILKMDAIGLQTAGGKEGMQAALGQAATHEAAKAAIARAIAPVVGGLKLDAAKSGLITFTMAPAFAAELSVDQIEALAKDPRVESIEIDREMRPQLNLTLPLIETPLAASGATGFGRTVVVIDTGIQRAHPFIGLARVAAEACFVTNNSCPNNTNQQIGAGAGEARPGQPHGTHVAGIAIGNRAAGTPLRGVANQARVIPINIFGTSGTTAFSTIQRAFEHVLTLKTTQPALNIAAVNMSVGGGSSVEACDEDSIMTLLRPVIDNLRRAGVSSAISAGNDGNTNAIAFPACLSSMVSVAAASKTGVVSSYTDISQTTDFFAPGGDFTSPGCVNSSVLGGAFSAFCGTSMASPHVAGAIAALRSRYPTVPASRIIQALRQTGVATRDTRTGGLHTKPRIRINSALLNLGTVLTPPNNNIALATVLPLTGATTRAIGHNVGATQEPGEPLHVGALTSQSVWWRFTAAATGNMRISTLGSDFDTELAVYRGSTIATLGPRLASNDNASPNVKFSQLTVPVVAGLSYSVVVAGHGATEQGGVHLTLARPLANDNFASAIVVPVRAGLKVSADGNNVGATREAGEPAHLSTDNSTSVWYRFTAPASGPMTLDTIGSNFDTVLGVYTGAAVSALTLVAINDDAVGLQSRVSINAVAGRVYNVAVTGYSGATGNFRLSITPPGASSSSWTSSATPAPIWTNN